MCGIVYDLIPYVFPDRYLEHADTRRGYLASLACARDYDHLLAISDATRDDLVRLAGVQPTRVTAIYGDIDHRKRLAIAEPSPQGTPRRFGLDSPYFIYVGGDDWRKNVAGMIRAFAAFSERQGGHQLALVCSMSSSSIARCQALAIESGLGVDAMKICGEVSDADLVGLMRQARAMVFPSLYEGLGLPVLEAYACGVPVIGSGVSSLREVTLAALQCRPDSPESIADAMERIVENPALRRDSLKFGSRLGERFSWVYSTKRVNELLDGQTVSMVGPGPTHKQLAVVGVLPPATTGIAPYTWLTMQSNRWQTDFFACTPPGDGATQSLPRYEQPFPGNRVLPVEVLSSVLALSTGHRAYQALLFVIGNSDHHTDVLRALLETRGRCSLPRWVYLHEANLTALLQPVFGVERTTPSSSTDPWISRVLADFPSLVSGLRFLCRVGCIDRILVNSAACRSLIQAALASAEQCPPIDVLFLPVTGSQLPQDSPRLDGLLRVAHFGILHADKRPGVLLDACARLHRHRPIQLTLAGWHVADYRDRHQLEKYPFVRCIDSPDKATLLSLMRETNVAVQLRQRTVGESSGVVAQLLPYGTQLVVTDEGSFRELPAGVTTHVSHRCNAKQLATAIEMASSRTVCAKELTAIVERYSLGTFHERFDSLLDQFCGQVQRNDRVGFAVPGDMRVQEQG